MTQLLKKLLIVSAALVLIGIVSVYSIFKYVDSTLPELIKVEDYKPLLVSQVYDRNGKKIGEYFRERRTLIPFNKIPKEVINAFLAAEDDQFFEHKGLNYTAILRATMANIKAGRTVQGGSTITQQVAKTLLLSSEKTVVRKLKDALLAVKMEKSLSKEDILFLYLNQIYFGQGAYGLATAAETYFRKPVEKLSLAESAILAGLPKAPSAFNPIINPSRAKERQIYVLNRMAEVGYVTEDQAQASAAEPIKVFLKERFETYAPFFLETIRQMLVSKLGEEMVLDQGLRIYTSLDLPKQVEAQNAMTKGLKDLDKRQGFRGPLRNTVEPKEVGEFLLKSRNKLIAEMIPERTLGADGRFTDYGPLNLEYDLSKGLPFYLPLGKSTEAIVSRVDDQLGLVYIRIAELEALIDFETMQWARKPNSDKRFDLDLIKKPSQALKMGDIILVKLTNAQFTMPARIGRMIEAEKKKKVPAGKTPAPLPPEYNIDWKKYVSVELDQEPLVEGSLLSLDQQTSEIVAHVGGYDFVKSKWDKALQAARQTGSSFKSIVYASALDKGYSASTPIMDAPIVFEETKEDDEGQEETKSWRPDNHSKSFSGDIIFRNALVKSLNVPTVKIVEDIGVHWISEYARRLGIFSPLNLDFTLGLGSSSVTLYEMTKVFSEFGRMGRRIHPIIVNKIVDSKGNLISEKITLDQRFQKEMADLDKATEERRIAYLESLKVPAENAADGDTAGLNENGASQANAPAKPVADDPKKPAVEPFLFFEDPDQLIKPTTAYLITSLLRAAVEDKNATGARARALGREVAGKTGTTSGYYDAWFLGYTQQFATGVWVGFEQEKTLGKGEVGGRSALPIWVDYMKAAHEELPVMTFPVPEGIVFANIDSETGQVASAASKSIVRQAFLEGTEPSATKSKKDEDTDFYKQDMTE